MKSSLEIMIRRIWAEEWTSLDKLDANSDLFGDLEVRVGGAALPGIHVEKPGEAHLNQCVRELMMLRHFKKKKASYTATFHTASPIHHVIRRDDDTLIFSAVYAGTKKPVPGFEALAVSYEQVKEELKHFRAKMRELLLTSCPRDAAYAWWKANALDDLDRAD